MSKKSIMIISVLAIFGVSNLLAEVPQQQLNNALEQEKILANNAFKNYSNGKNIDKYMTNMKNVNNQLMKMVQNSDVKKVIEYISMEIDKVNSIHNKESLLRLHKEIAESSAYIKMTISSN